MGPISKIVTVLAVSMSLLSIGMFRVQIRKWSRSSGLIIQPKTNPERLAVAECLDRLPQWTQSPNSLEKAFVIGSHGLTDKSTFHRYQYMYHRYLVSLILRTCLPQNHIRPIRMLEIGLGCAPGGGMINGTPGGSAWAWKYMFGDLLDLHTMEYDKGCALEWYETHKNISTIHTGDASLKEDLDRVYHEAGSQPFDIIVDDGSHLNEHQIKTLEFLISRVAPGGVYVIEDIMSSCNSWAANIGNRFGEETGGTEGCMVTSSGATTIYGKIVEWQKQLIRNQQPFPGVNNIDVWLEAVVFTKQTN